MKRVENAVLSFSGIVSVLHEIYGIHLLKNGFLLIHRQEGHIVYNLKGC